MIFSKCATEIFIPITPNSYYPPHPAIIIPVRYFFPLILLSLLIPGCLPSYVVPDLSTPSPGPATIFLLDHAASMSLVDFDGNSSGDDASVLFEPVKIGDTVTRALSARSTGAFLWTGDIPENAKFTALLGVGDASVGLFNVGGIVPPISRYGPADTEPSFDIIFRIHLNGLNILEEKITQDDFDSWLPVTLDLADFAGENIKLLFTIEGVIIGTKIAWWGNPQIVVPRQTPRRVVLLGLDTLAAGHVGWHGCDRPTTPNLDRLSKNSMVFLNAHSPSSWTLPAFAAVLSGRNPGLTGADRRNRGLSDHEDMLAEIFRRNGFATAGFVNIPHLQEAGFFQGNDHQWEVHDHPAVEALDQAKAWIEQHDSQDYFIFIHLFDPHIPYTPPQEYADAFRDPNYEGDHANTWDLPARIITQNHLDPIVWQNFNDADKKQCESLYDAEIAGMDEGIGDFLDWYSDRGLLDDTLFIVFADHGEEFGEHGRWEHGHSMYEEQIHVPFLIKFPNQAHQAVYDGLVGTIDIYPTLLELFGLTSQTEPSGQSLIDFIEHNRTDSQTVIISESTLWGPEFKSVTDPRYKYILDMHSGGEEFYDLSIDPEETENILDNQPDPAELLGNYLEQYINNTQSGWHLRLLAGPQWPMDVNLSISSDAAFENVDLIEQIYNGSGDGITFIADNEFTLDLNMNAGDSVELRFTTGDPSAIVTFSGTIEDVSGDVEPRSAIRTIKLGSEMLALPDLLLKLASEGAEVPGVLAGSDLALTIDHPTIAFSFPEYTIDEFRGAFLWTIPENLRAHEASLTPEQQEALESVGYFFN